MLEWKDYSKVKPAACQKFQSFVVALPNPRLYSSKFANLHVNNGIDPYVFDVQCWLGDKFTVVDHKVKYWAPLPQPEVCK